jgi:fructose-bisphosphate aldolase class I
MAGSAYAAELIATANAIGSPGKGILAADESTGTIGKRFAAINLENNLENRTKYRQLLFSTEGLGEFISGAICFEETLFATGADGVPLIQLLQNQGIIPGIKVDKGVQILPGTDGEGVTQGITDLGARCAKYYAQGARFSKWRAVINISDSGAPSQLAIDQNAYTLARYAAISQANGLVPIVEPEVLMDGPHSIHRAAEVSAKIQAACFKALSGKHPLYVCLCPLFVESCSGRHSPCLHVIGLDHHVLLEGCMLKPNMVRKGTLCTDECTAEDIARATVTTLQRTVPPALPTICFLSGGMSEEEATEALNAINRYGNPAKKPWSLTFSYGRALQQSVLQAWQGSDDNLAAAQAALLVRAKANSEAQRGVYSGDAAGEGAATASLHVENYKY